MLLFFFFLFVFFRDQRPRAPAQLRGLALLGQDEPAGSRTGEAPLAPAQLLQQRARRLEKHNVRSVRCGAADATVPGGSDEAPVAAGVAAGVAEDAGAEPVSPPLAALPSPSLPPPCS